MGKVTPMIGKRFGLLTVIEKAGVNSERFIMYKCACDCGGTRVVSGKALRQGRTLSCGCLMHKKKHGGCGTKNRERLYDVWRSMKRRAGEHNPYKWYQGITMCEEWKDYARFREWSYANGYDENAPKWECTLDRIDYKGNYEPSNCRFVNESMQMFNRRKPKSKLGVRGVRQRGRKYVAVITKDRKRIDLGKFDNIQDAIDARHEAELKYYGMTLDS